jgi:hypothetical protein
MGFDRKGSLLASSFKIYNFIKAIFKSKIEVQQKLPIGVVISRWYAIP